VDATGNGVIPLRLLDLFSGAGGAAMGYARAGFVVTGVDRRSQPNYPFRFLKGDVFDVIDRIDLGRFDAIHASPPCQRYSDLARRNGNADEWPDLVAPVRDRLRSSGRPYVIENVEGAPLIDPVILCGTMFPGLRVLRHRLFESNIPLTAPVHPPHPLVFTHDKRKAQYGKLDQATAFVMVNGGGNATVANKADAMGIDWMTGGELNEAIPPAYTRHLGRQVRRALETRVA